MRDRHDGHSCSKHIPVGLHAGQSFTVIAARLGKAKRTIDVFVGCKVAGRWEPRRLAASLVRTSAEEYAAH